MKSLDEVVFKCEKWVRDNPDHRIWKVDNIPWEQPAKSEDEEEELVAFLSTLVLCAWKAQGQSTVDVPKVQEYSTKLAQGYIADHLMGLVGETVEEIVGSKWEPVFPDIVTEFLGDEVLSSQSVEDRLQLAQEVWNSLDE